MFAQLSERLSQAFQKLRGVTRLTTENIQDSLQEIRMALSDADVALPVVQAFLQHVQQKAIGTQVIHTVQPDQMFTKIVHDELVTLLGGETSEIALNHRRPIVILVAGLQGSGKTTSIAKLAHWLQVEKKQSVLVTSADIYRPAAIQQLQILAENHAIRFCPSSPGDNPAAIVHRAIAAAKADHIDVVMIDTAGRLHIDAAMMEEVKQLHQAAQPTETLFVIDSMTGQDAANAAKAFHDALPLTGVIITKTDGDARGGAALSVKYITGKPIKFMGTGEKITDFECFHPERIASRILGMGDILSLVEQAERTLDRKQAQKLAKKIQTKQGFDLEDFLVQLQQMRQLGGVKSLLTKLPGINQLSGALREKLDDKPFKKMEAIVNSMTPQERRFPALIKGSRKQRIAAGSGTQPQDVNSVLKQFTQMQKMMRKLSKGGMKKMMYQMQQALDGANKRFPRG